MSEPKFSQFNYTDPETLKFLAEDVDCSLLNAIRRIIIGEVPTIGFRTEYGRESDIKILKNTSALHNEFLAHRLSLIPIHYTNFDDFNPDKYLFVLKKQNNTNRTMDITTENIEVKDITKDPPVIMSDSFRENLFPRDPITKDFILINKLKPSKSGLGDEGEELDITMRATMGIGNENSQFCPTCVSVFTNIQDPDKVEAEFNDLIDRKNAERKGNPLTKDEISQERLSFNSLDAQRYFYTDERGEPNKFDFTIESDGRIPSHDILTMSMDIFKDHIRRFVDSVKDETKVEIYNSDCIMNSYDVAIDDEDYTIGYLLQYYIYKLYQNIDQPVVKYVASNVPHPLESKLVFRIGMVESGTKPEAIRKLIVNTCEVITNQVSKLRQTVTSQRFK